MKNITLTLALLASCFNLFGQNVNHYQNGWTCNTYNDTCYYGEVWDDGVLFTFHYSDTDTWATEFWRCDVSQDVYLVSDINNDGLYDAYRLYHKDVWVASFIPELDIVISRCESWYLDGQDEFEHYYNYYKTLKK